MMTKIAGFLTAVGSIAATIVLCVGWTTTGIADIGTGNIMGGLQNFCYDAGAIGALLHMHFTFNLLGLSVSTNTPVK